MAALAGFIGWKTVEERTFYPGNAIFISRPDSASKIQKAQSNTYT